MGSHFVMGPYFAGTASFLPHTGVHIFTFAELRHKKLYDDLIQLGSYYARKKESSLRRERDSDEKRRTKENRTVTASTAALSSSSCTVASGSASADPDTKRRFIVTAVDPNEPGVFAEYGLLFQLRDLDDLSPTVVNSGDLVDMLRKASGNGGEEDNDDDDDDNDDEDYFYVS